MCCECSICKARRSGKTLDLEDTIVSHIKDMRCKIHELIEDAQNNIETTKNFKLERRGAKTILEAGGMDG